MTFPNVIANDTTMDNANNFTLTYADAGLSEENYFVFHIGANEKQMMKMGTIDITTNGIGISDISFLTRDEAEKGTTTLDQVIQKVPGYRSMYRAIQNRLEHIINNLNNSAENLTIAESRIRDVDIEKEMMTQMKHSILSQAAQAMLAQAKQQPQGVLQLLR
ncbi:flagellin [Peribacillus sp. Hz7]|uniref:flagellin n=1 Tax=Peribacillus sp. Hz7 TaxID=3344873 RepID=UPI0035C9FDF6